LNFETGLQIIFRVIKVNEDELSGTHSTQGNNKNACRILVAKTHGTTPHGKPGYRPENEFKTTLWKMACENVN
jgi:hypothetical protein